MIVESIGDLHCIREKDDVLLLKLLLLCGNVCGQVRVGIVFSGKQILGIGLKILESRVV